MLQSTESEEKVISTLQNNNFTVTKERVFGHKWIVDLVGERGDTILLVEYKSGAPPSNADVFDLVALRNSGEFRNRKTKCFILTTGRFQLDKESPIFKVAEAGDVRIIYGETLSSVLENLNSQIVGLQS
jgi:hypothetical protein